MIMILPGAGMGARLPEALVWPVAQPEQQPFPEQEAAMEAGKMRICLILVQEVRSPRSRRI
jgi:hypothetical protein